MLKSAGRKQKAEGTSAGIAVVLLVVAAAAAAAATLSGVVLDADTRQPVSYAAVSAPNLDLNVTADSTGAFALEVEPGLRRVTVTVSRVGSEEKRWEKVDISRPATFYLRPSPVRMEGISVSAFRTPSPLERSGPVSIIEGRNAGADGRLSLAELLWVSSSVISKDYGNLVTIGLRGANTEQTLILLDGVRLNSEQDNLFDLTTLPLLLVAAATAGPVRILRGSAMPSAR